MLIMFKYWIFSTIFLIIITKTISCIHVQGIWSPSTSLFKVITRFGFRPTDPNHRLETSGYVFGNVTLINPSAIEDSNEYNYNSGILLFANRTLFKHIYSLYLKTKLQKKFQCDKDNQTNIDIDNQFCHNIFKSIENQQNSICKSNDYYRFIPCPLNGICDNKHCNNSNDYDNQNIYKIINYQLTFLIDDQKDANFWYLLLLPCRMIDRNQFKNSNQSRLESEWTRQTDTNLLLSYDLWIVNGNPLINRHNNMLSVMFIDTQFQFSYEQQNIWFFIVFNVFYIILFIIQLYIMIIIVHKRRTKIIYYYIFTISLLLHSLSYFFICLHKIVFAQNGKGFETLFIISEIMKIMSIALLIIFVIIIAKGWPFTKPETFSKTILIIISTIYITINILLFIWVKNSINMIEEVDEYHTIPGWLILILRLLLMSWFIYELRHTMMLEHNQIRLKFYLHFGAGILVWFIHLPLVALVAMHIDLMWRLKIIISFTSIADFITYTILTKIIWKANTTQFLITDLDSYQDYDYDNSLVYNQQQNEQQLQNETIKFSNTSNMSTHRKYMQEYSIDNGELSMNNCDSNNQIQTPISSVMMNNRNNYNRSSLSSLETTIPVQSNVA